MKNLTQKTSKKGRILDVKTDINLSGPMFS